MSAISSLYVSLKFKSILDRLSPPAGAFASALVHCNEIRSRLIKTFAVKRATQIGSHSKGTAIKGWSDVDYLVVLSREEARKWARDLSSSTLVNRIRADLQGRFPSTRIRRDGQAIVVNFSKGHVPVDVVPAVFSSFSADPRYLISDGQGGWTETSPDGQKRLLKKKNLESGGKLIPLIRLLKWWASSRDVTSVISSYYLETFLIGLRIPIGVTYATAVAETLGILVRRRCASISDPLGISRNLIVATSTSSQRAGLLDALAAASDRSRYALEAEARGDHGEALRQWSIVFNHNL